MKKQVFLILILLMNTKTISGQKYCELFDTEVSALLNNTTDIDEATVLVIVNEIIEEAGIAKNFIVRRNSTIDNLRAEVKMIEGSEEKFITYNMKFINGIYSQFSKWSVYGAFAHEIAHHLNSDYLNSGVSTRPKELAADYYSGKLLKKLGASLEEAKASMKSLATNSGSNSHPPKAERLAAIEKGWLSVKSNNPKLSEEKKKQEETKPEVSSSFFVPNTFTPNGDGMNDFFLVKGGSFSEFELTIYSRWGENIFTTKDQSVGWNGKKKNSDGKEVPASQDTYFYSLKVTDLKGEKIDQKGTITLLR